MPNRHSMPEYRAWCKMIERCENPNTKNYHRYGGRGITVCTTWRKDFAVFYADMGQKPSLEHSLDRKDNSKEYSKDNCRWATEIEQQNNRRDNIVLDYQGQKDTLPNWCRKLGLCYQTIRARILRGWTAERAFQTKIRKLTFKTQ